MLGSSPMEWPGGTGRGGVFHPAAAFDAVRPVFRRWQDVVQRDVDLIAARPRGSSPEAIRAQVRESGVGDALEASMAEIAALGLEMRAPSGERLAADQILVTEWAIPVPELTAEQRADVQADFVQHGMTLEGPNYMIVVIGDVGWPDPDPPESDQPGE